MKSVQSDSSGSAATRPSLVRVPLRKTLDIKVIHVGIRPKYMKDNLIRYGIEAAFEGALEARKQYVLAEEVKRAMAEEEDTEGLDIR